MGEAYFSDIAGKGKKMICFSVSFFSQLLTSLTIAKKLKKINPEIIIVFGGNTNKLIKEKIPEYKRLFEIVDFFVLGDGEETLFNLIKFHKNKDNSVKLEDISNIFYLKDGKVNFTNEDSFDINNAVSPEYDFYNTNKYYFSSIPNNLLLPMRTALGCYWNKCGFCSLSLAKYRQRKIELLIQDINHVVKKYHPSDIWFVDLSISAERLKLIAAALIENKIKVNWRCFTRFEKGYTPETCRLLAKSGCNVLTFGLESGNDRVNALINKGFELSLAETILANLAFAGIRTSVACVAGFPTETEEEYKDTLKFLEKNRENISYYSINIFSLNSDSHVYYNPEKYGVTKIEEPEGYFYIRHLNYKIDKGLTREETQQILRNTPRIKKSKLSLLKFRFRRIQNKIKRMS